MRARPKHWTRLISSLVQLPVAAVGVTGWALARTPQTAASSPAAVQDMAGEVQQHVRSQPRALHLMHSVVTSQVKQP